MSRSFSILSIAVLIVAILAWVGVWFLFSDISTRLTERADTLSTNDVQSSKQASAVAMHALVSDTTDQRTQLDSAVSADVVGIGLRHAAAAPGSVR